MTCFACSKVRLDGSFVAAMALAVNLLANGSAAEAVIAPRLALADLVNRSLIVHATRDDNSARFACGVLK